MQSEEPLRILTDDFSCRVLSDMIWKEEESTCTGLFYGVNCSAPLIVPIARTESGSDYQMWVAFEATSDLMQRTVPVQHDEDIKQCILLYANQARLPYWYSNKLLSRGGRTLKGNFLLVLPAREWPEHLVVPPEAVARWMQAAEDRVEERRDEQREIL